MIIVYNNNDDDNRIIMIIAVITIMFLNDYDTLGTFLNPCTGLCMCGSACVSKYVNLKYEQNM